MRITRLIEIQGYYGYPDPNPCTILVAETSRGGTWYCVEGSTNVNETYDTLAEGVNVEGVNDCDTAQANAPVECLEDLERELEEM